jgi:Ca-activated chloride channel homolog
MLSQFWLTIVFLMALLVSCSNQLNQSQSSDITGSPPEKPDVVQTPQPAKLKKETTTAFNKNAAEAYYQKLMAQYGENYPECLEKVEVQLQKNPPPDLATTNITSPKLNVVIALDSSGSMAENVNGEPKLKAAQIAIAEFVDSLPDTTQISLIAFGHKGSNADADKAISCQGIETVYPLSDKNSDRFKTAVNSFSPKGYTPLAATLKLAGQNLATLKNENNRNVIYLVSDGVETCDGDPVAIAKQLQNSKTELIINVIGFDVDNTAQQQLKAIAQAGGGEYYTASDRASLQQVWQENTTKLNSYRLENLTNQNQVFLTLTKASNDLFLCITQKKNQEFLNVIKTLNKLSPNDPNAQYREYVQERMSQKRERIDQWRENLTADLENKRDVTIKQLKQELETVEKDSQL